MAHNRMTLSMLCWSLVLVWLLAVPAVAQPDFSEAVVNFNEAAEVSGEAIYLRDLAEISGSDEAVAVLASVYVGRAPLSGAARILNQGHVEVRLRQSGINPRQLSLLGAASITVKGIAGQVEETEAENAGQPAHPNKETEEKENPNLVSLVVAAQDIARGDILTADHVREEHREQTGRVVETSADDFLGQRATRYVREGQVLVTAAAEVPPVMDRGAAVYILAEVGSIRVTVPGTARDSGGIGEAIRVQNNESRQVVEAVIIDAEHVAVAVKGADAP